MGMSNKSLICPIDKNCAEWAKYIGYCLCSKREGFSLALGVISVLSWGVAEVPQIMTNCKLKSAGGLSLVFLFTWILGDFFNVFGCMLEPATLPTQYYTALLYLATTTILVTQAVYYEHIYPRLKSQKRKHEVMQSGLVEKERQHSHGTDNEQTDDLRRYLLTPTVPIPPSGSLPNISHEELYIMSARSLSVSRTPPAISFLHQGNPNADVEQHWSREPSPNQMKFPQSAPTPKIKTTLCVVFVMMFFLSSWNRQLPESSENSFVVERGNVLQLRRQILQATRTSGETLSTESSSMIGTFLGWGMAAIYLGGRLPQIYLNSKRGHAEGLNPLMFIFALLGNSTYVASILVSSLKWSKIQPNLPWLVDAGGCMFLDTFIVLQFIYFRYRKTKGCEKYVS